MFDILRATLILPALSGLLACSVSPDAALHEQTAEHAARSWLTYIDTGEYGKSWDTASDRFRAAIRREQWEVTVQKVQGPLGAPASRELIIARYTNRPLYSREGEHVIAQYRTTYADRRMIETIFMVRNGNRWPTDGYLISFYP